MKTSFTGTSPHGDLTEAIKNALKKAAAENNKDMGWTLQKTSGNQLGLGPISVTILVGGGKGDDTGGRGVK